MAWSRWVATPIVVAAGAAIVAADLVFRNTHHAASVFGLLSIALGTFLHVRLVHWAECMSRLLERVRPVPMRLAFAASGEGGTSTTVTPVDGGPSRTVQIDEPAWNFRQYEGSTADVFMDPDNPALMAIRTASGFIWPVDQFGRLR